MHSTNTSSRAASPFACGRGQSFYRAIATSDSLAIQWKLLGIGSTHGCRLLKAVKDRGWAAGFRSMPGRESPVSSEEEHGDGIDFRQLPGGRADRQGRYGDRLPCRRYEIGAKRGDQGAAR